MSESVRRTSINLDMDLVRQAGELLGTERTTDTVHAAMREIVARELRRRLTERDFPDLTPEALAELRKPRTFD